MDEKIYLNSILEYYRDKTVEKIEFYYPANINWACEKCGLCCGDVDGRSRVILLLPSDIERIQGTGESGFFKDWDDLHFIGIMCKNDGKCVFYKNKECKIYTSRALLCRMYPFWLEKQEDVFVFGIDPDCSGIGKGRDLDEGFFRNLLDYALKAMDY
jgi:uncharacterized protein